MIDLPDPGSTFSHELDFLLTCSPSRIGKILALCDLYRQIRTVPGAIVEAGVFRGGSFTLWAMLRHLLETEHARALIGFDTFDRFPAAERDADQHIVDHIDRTAGLDCIGTDQLMSTLAARGRGLDHNVQLIAGDVTSTVPTYVEQNPQLAISLLMIDTDLHAPAVTCLTHLVPRVTRGGIVVVDNFGVFPGETDAVREYLTSHDDVVLQRSASTGHLTYFVVDRTSPRI